MTLNTGAKGGGFAMEQESTYGTAVSVGASDGIDLTSFSPTDQGKQIVPRSTLGKPSGDENDIGAELRGFSIGAHAFYGGGTGRLFAAIFGADSVTNNTGSYSHEMTWQDSLADFFTACKGYRIGQKWHEYAGAMCRSLRIGGSGQGRMDITAEFVAKTRDKDSSTNTTTETDAVTVPTKNVAVYLHQAVFRINAQSGGALASPTDVVALGSLSIEFRRPLSQDILSGSASIDQPSEDGENAILITVSRSNYADDTWLDLVEASGVTGQPTAQKADITLSSGYTPSGGLELSMLFQFPYLTTQGVQQPAINGPGRIPEQIVFKAIEAATAPTGMSGITQPCKVTIEDERSTAWVS